MARDDGGFAGPSLETLMRRLDKVVEQHPSVSLGDEDLLPAVPRAIPGTVTKRFTEAANIEDKVSSISSNDLAQQKFANTAHGRNTFNEVILQVLLDISRKLDMLLDERKKEKRRRPTKRVLEFDPLAHGKPIPPDEIT